MRTEWVFNKRDGVAEDWSDRAPRGTSQGFCIWKLCYILLRIRVECSIYGIVNVKYYYVCVWICVWKVWTCDWSVWRRCSKLELLGECAVAVDVPLFQTHAMECSLIRKKFSRDFAYLVMFRFIFMKGKNNSRNIKLILIYLSILE